MSSLTPTRMTSLVLVAIFHTSFLSAQENDYAQAYRLSVATGRPLVVLIGASWCPGCQQMKKLTLPRVAQAGGLRNVVFTYVDMDQQPELASQLSQAQSIPQLIRLEKTQAGWHRRVLVGAKSPEEVHSFVNAGLAATADSHRRPDSHHSSRPVGHEAEPATSSYWSGLLSSVYPFSSKRAHREAESLTRREPN